MHHLKPADDLALVAAVIEAVGDKMAVMFDANQAGKSRKSPPPAWDYERAALMAKEMEQMGVYWLEEPLNRNSLEDLARIRKQLTRMHLAGAEGDRGLERFRTILTQNAFSYIQPDPVTGGGLSVLRTECCAWRRRRNDAASGTWPGSGGPFRGSGKRGF